MTRTTFVQDIPGAVDSDKDAPIGVIRRTGNHLH
jgi:hypothetical protein